MYNFNFLSHSSFYSPDYNMVILAAGTKAPMEGNFISVHCICGFKNMRQFFFSSFLHFGSSHKGKIAEVHSRSRKLRSKFLDKD